jgi:flagellar biosynthesis/type III secretory pathway M-ring protein FliF/YscJ
VSAKVGNGDVTLRVSVFSPTGVLVSQPGVVDVNVQAEWEGVGSAVFAALVVLFFGFGVWRNIARRRKERVASSIAASEADAGSSGTATPSEPTGTRANLVPAVGQGTESPRG